MVSSQQQQLQKEICDTVGVQIHRQLKAVLNEISEFKPSPLQLIFTSQYLKSILFNVAYQQSLHSDWCFDKHWLKYLCNGVIPSRLWDFFQRGEGLRSSANSEDLDVKKTIELAEGSANYDVDHGLDKSTNLYRYLTGQQPLIDHHDWPPSADIKVAKDVDSATDLRTSDSHNERHADLGLDLSAYPKAEMAINFRPDVQAVIAELEAYFPEYAELLIDTLEAQPKIDSDSLKRIIYETHDAEYSVYENPTLNDALLEASRLGRAAKAEMKEVLDTLGSTADIAAIMKSLAAKYSEITEKAEQYKKGHITSDNGDKLSRFPAVDNLSASRSEPVISNELPESLNMLTAREPQIAESDTAIRRITKPDGRYEYEFGGKRYYSEKAARSASQSQSFVEKDEFSSVSSPSQEIVELAEKYQVNGLAGLLDIFGIKRTYIGPKTGHKYTWNDQLYNTAEAAVLKAAFADQSAGSLQGMKSTNSVETVNASLNRSSSTAVDWLFGIMAFVIAKFFGLVGAGAVVVGWLVYSRVKKEHGITIGVMAGVTVGIASYGLAVVAILDNL